MPPLKLNVQDITAQSLRDHRRYIYVGILFFAGCITESPNYLAQVKIAVPLILLFEISTYLLGKLKNR